MGGSDSSRDADPPGANLLAFTTPRCGVARRTFWFPLAILTAGCFCGPVAAQQTEPLSIRLPPVVVIGTNDWEQPAIQRLPLAVTAWSGEQLELAGISSTLDLRGAIPNFSQSYTGLRSYADNYVVRGLGNTQFLSDPAVVLYVDDAPSGNVLTYTTDLLAIDHVEVYRGPQGSRFGRNSEAGVINIVTRRPGDRFEAEARASIATFNTQQYQAGVLGPLVKGKLRFDLVGQYASSDGFIRNNFLNTRADQRDGLDGRASLHWTPSDQWNVDFTATADRFRDGIGLVSLSGDPHRTQSDFDGKFDEDVNSQSLRVRGSLSDLAITSVTTRRDFNLHPFMFDPDFSPLAGNTGIVNWAEAQWSQELRVSPVAPEGKWDWRAGFFFATAETDLHRPYYFFVPPLGLSGSDTVDYTEISDSYALFGEVTRSVGEKLDVTLGLRLDYTVRDFDRTRTSTFSSPPAVHVNEGFFNTAPKLTLAYHVRDAVLVYGSTGLGFKPGGFTAFIDPPQSPKFDTETAWASEIGVKSAWLDGKLTANVALFYYDVTDYQVEQFAPMGFDIVVVNAHRARSLGAELELMARPATGWELSAFGGYTDARLEHFTDPFTGATFRDSRPPFVAEFNAGVSAQYKHKSGLSGRVGYVVVGDTFYDAANTSDFKQSAYGLLSARVGFECAHFGIYLFGENLTDTEYFSKKIPPLNGGAPGRPQLFGVMVVARF